MPLKTQIDEQPTLNLAPMIDIVFLLVIFFMVGTKFQELEERERKIPLRVPEVADNGVLTPPPSRRVVNVYQDSRVTLDDEDVTLDELTGRLSDARRQYPDLGVLVRGDGKVVYQCVASVLNACKQAGVEKLDVSVRVARRDN
ncbi:MAG TPA: biopolymer transporter ExbD [Thermoguttaceae bacterium]|nr:biopolymer transporter ExbD [Thermoguttaceae bacterium]